MLRLSLALLLALTTLVAAAENVTSKPKRIITLGSAITETVFELNAGHRVVAVDVGSRHPPLARELPQLGEISDIQVSDLLALKPDLVIASQEVGPTSALTQLHSHGIKLEIVQVGPSVEEALTAMERVGEALGSRAGGKWLARDNRKALQRISARYADEADNPRVLFLHVKENGETHIGGDNTPAATMIDLAQAQNVATGFNSYRSAKPALTQGLQPDVIVAVTDGYLEEEALASLLRSTGLEQSPASRNGRVVDLSSSLLLGMGPRLGAAAAVLAEVIREKPDPIE